MTSNTPSGTKKHHESAEPESRQMAKICSSSDGLSTLVFFTSFFGQVFLGEVFTSNYSSSDSELLMLDELSDELEALVASGMLFETLTEVGFTPFTSGSDF